MTAVPSAFGWPARVAQKYGYAANKSKNATNQPSASGAVALEAGNASHSPSTTQVNTSATNPIQWRPAIIPSANKTTPNNSATPNTGVGSSGRSLAININKSTNGVPAAIAGTLRRIPVPPDSVGRGQTENPA